MNSKLILFGAIMLALLPSCLKESDHESTLEYSCTNLIVPASSEGSDVTVSESTYSSVMTSNSGNITIACKGLIINGTGVSFTTDPVRYNGFTSEFGSFYLFRGNSAETSNGMLLSNFNGEVAGAVYYPVKGVEVPGIDFMPASVYGPKALFQYDLSGADGKYHVITFSRDASYVGYTQTKYNFKGEDKTFVTDKILYRVVFSRDYKKADMVIYFAKFAEEQPKEIAAMALKGLDVKFDEKGYTITGKDVVPQVPEGGVLTPYPAFTFSSISFDNHSRDLATAEFKYQVTNPGGGLYEGEFKGAYGVVPAYETQQ